MRITDRVIGQLVRFAMAVFVLLGVILLVASVVNGFDLELLMMGLGSLSWTALLAIGMQPWRD